MTPNIYVNYCITSQSPRGGTVVTVPDVTSPYNGLHLTADPC